MSQPHYEYWIHAVPAPSGLTFDGEASFSEPEDTARAGQLEELQQENQMFPWLEDGSMADPPEEP